MASYVATQDQDEQVKKLRRLLEGWRMALLTLKSVILWEQQWHPCAIFGAVTSLYFFVWIMNLNSLATFAMVGFLLNFVDFIVPRVSNLIYGSSNWTGQHEKLFIEICNNIVVSYNKTFQSIRAFYSLRETSPVAYFAISTTMLCTLAWMASSVNNTFLLYILTTVMVLWPGLARTAAFNSMLSVFNMAPKIPFLKTE